MVGIAFHIPKSTTEKCRDIWQLHIDFIRETALSFEAHYFVFGASDEVAKYIEDDGRGTAVKSIQELPKPWVLVTPWGAPMDGHTPLESGTYIFGPDVGNEPRLAFLGIPEVRVPTPRGYPLWAAVAAGIVLSNRYAQGCR